MLLLIQFLIAHFVGDFFLQPRNWVTKKEALKLKSKELYFHVLIHGLLLVIFTMDLSLWLPIVLITISHLVIDCLKLLFQNEQTRPHWFFIDQLMHIVAIAVIWYICQGHTVSVTAFNATNFALVVLGAIFLTQPCSYIIKNLISRIPLLSENPSLTDAGRYIGMIERIFILVFIITNHWQAVGFILAAKSIFRFGDLKGDNRKLTEYVMIGTLLSFGIAILVSLLIFYAITDNEGNLNPILILRDNN